MIKLKSIAIVIQFFKFFNFLLLSIAKGLVFKRNDCVNRVNHIALGLADHIPPGSLVHIILPEDNAPCLLNPGTINLFPQWQVIISQPNTLSHIKDSLITTPDAFIVFMRDYEIHYQHQLYHLIMMQLNLYTKSWNPGAKFLLIATTKLINSTRIQHLLAIETLNFLWRRNIFRVGLVIFQDNGAIITMYSSAPFSKEFGTCREIFSPKQLQEIDITVGNISTLPIVGFQFKTPKSFLGCPLRGSTYPNPPYSIAKSEEKATKFDRTYTNGIEINLFMLLAKQHSFYLKINTADNTVNNGWYRVFPNGSSAGMLKDIVNYNIDMAFAGCIPFSMSPQNYSYFLLNQINTHVFNSLSWYVSNPDLVPPWKLVLNVFSRSTWLLLTLQLVFFTLLFYFMSNLLPDFGENEEKNEPLYLTMLRSTLGSSITWFPTVSNQKIMLVSWFLFSLNVTIMYNTKLFSLLSGRPLNPGINTVKDLYESRFKACTASIYKTFYTNRTESYIRGVFEKTFACDNVPDTVEEFLNNRDFSVLVKDDYMSFLVDIKRANVHTLKEKLITYPVVIYITKGNIMIEPLINIIQRITETGIVQKWLNDLHREVKVKFTSTKRTHSVFEHSSLKIDDFAWLFLALLGGHIGSFFVFTMEICYSKQSHL